ncbi:MAG: uracil-DNA glycosylase [Gammaproteobacteria bacterium]|nr:uracil-DNA glycosylase [Gammaproteobacteria bacterium]
MIEDEAVRRRYLHALGITQWERRSALPVQGGAMGQPVPVADAPLPGTDADSLEWRALEQTVRGCTRCPLHKTRTQAVFGVGNKNAEWLVIGEAPGADEDRLGEPFVGRAGQLLTSMLKALGLAREQVYIANILKSRPPNNRDPLPEEVAACEPYLKRQIELIRPRIILAVGRIAAQNLLKTDTRIGALRGQRFTCPGTDIPVVVTYHPAYLLRSPLEKRKAWEDLKFARRVMRGEV